MEDVNNKTAAAALGANASGGVEGGRKLFQYLGAMAACLFAVCMGTTMGWTSAAERIVCAAINCTEGDQALYISKGDYSWVGAAMPLGATIAALPAGPAITRWGRKNMLLFLSPVTFLFWLLIIFARASWMMILARFVIGASIGTISMIAPLYTSEIAHPSVRGTLGGFFQFLHTCGVLGAYCLGAVIADLVWISTICACVPLLAGVCFFFFPETPSWLLQQNREDDARRSLIRFRGDDYPEALLQEELDSIKRSIKESRENQKTLREAFSTKAAKRGLMLSMVLMLIQQMSGVSAVVFYASSIFEAAGSSLSKDQSSIVVGVCLAGATLCSLFLVDRLGRRVLLLGSGAACFVCNVVLGIYLLLLAQAKDDGHPESMTPYGIIPVLTMSVFMVTFSLGYGPIPWSYMAEVFPVDIRSPAMSIATVTNWSLAFLVTVAYEPLSNAVHDYTTFWIFAVIVLAGSVVVALFLVETKGKSEQEIQEALSGARPGSARNNV
ncbi:facilitated trehalose transporter Tret1-like isoform X2 [Thrips palmi]|nr:facilitated trehalose transporter Tret1-like isoform X2 [Thrips palmi]